MNFLRRTFAFILTFFLVVELCIPVSGVIVKADSGVNPITITNLDIVTVDSEDNASEITSDTVLKYGDNLKITFDWSIENNVSDETEFEVEITPIQGVVLSNIPATDLYADVKVSSDPDVYEHAVVGTYEVITTSEGVNKMLFHLTNENYIKNTTQRHGTAKINASVGIDEGLESDGKPATISVAGVTKTFIYETSQSESTVSLNKYKSDGGVYLNGTTPTQKFEASIKANGGDIKEIAVTETPGSGLTNMSAIEISYSTSSSITSGTTYSSMADLNAALSTVVLKAGEEIKFKYTMEVDPEIRNASDNSEYTNTITVDYRDNNGEYEQATDSEVVTVTKPSVSKTGELIESETKVLWTITINLNDYAKLGVDINDITSVTEFPGEQFDEYTITGEALDLSSITEVSTGVYKLTYTATIKDEYVNSVTPVALNNTVKTVIEGNEYTGTGSISTTGADWGITKNYALYEKDVNSGKMVVTWQVTIPNIPSGITNLKLTDTTNEWTMNGGTHHLLSGITVDGVEVVDSTGTLVESNGIISAIENSWNTNNTIVFEDSYVTSKVGSDIVVTYRTEIQDEDTYGLNYKNKASLSYSSSLSTNTVTAESIFVDPTAVAPAISKEGKVVSGTNTFAYTIKINLNNINNLTAGTSITVSDQLPDGMIVATTPEIFDGRKDTYNYWNLGDGDYSNMTSNYGVSVTAATMSYTENASGLVTFTIPVDESLLTKITAANDNSQVPYLQINYNTKLTSEKFSSLTGTTDFTNAASGTYNSDSIGEDAVTLSLTPESIVEKSATYDSSTKPYVNYKLLINPDKMDLSAGYVEAVDTLGPNSALYYDLTDSQINVYKYVNNTWSALVKGVDYNWVYNMKNNSIKFTLPDEEYIKIEYRAVVGLAKGEKLTAENSTNELTITGYTPDSTKDSHWFENTTVLESDVIGTHDYVTVYIDKYWDNNGVMERVDGSTFDIIELVYDSTTDVLSYGDTVAEGICVDSATNGAVAVPNLRYDRLYAIIEKDAQAGFLVNREPYYFVVIGQSGVELPDDINIMRMNTVSTNIMYENELVDANALTGEVTFEATKLLNGVTTGLSAYTFDFVVEELADSNGLNANPSGYVVAAGTSNAAGEITFDNKVSFTSQIDSHIGTHYYKISESDFTYSDVTKDDSYYIVKVDVGINSSTELDVTKSVTKYVSDGNGGYTAQSATEVEFNNTVGDSPFEESVSFEAVKKLNDSTDLSGFGFDFKLEKLSQSSYGTTLTAKPSGTLVDTVTATDSGEITFADAVTYKSASVNGSVTEYYMISEEDVDYAGITKDETFYIVKVTATENLITEDFEIEKEITKYTLAAGSYTATTVSEVEFSNESKPATVSFELTKTLDGATADLANYDGFTFKLTEVNGTSFIPIASGYSESVTDSDKDGAVKFTDIVYDVTMAEKTYCYMIEEDSSVNTQSDVIYDKNYYIATVDVAVSPVDGGVFTTVSITKYVAQDDGTYTTEAVTADTITFANETVSTPGVLQLGIVKTVLDKGGKEAAVTADHFEFAMVQATAVNETTGEIIPVANSEVTGKANANGRFQFDKIVYSDSDVGNTYYYKVYEKANDTDMNYVYDQSFYIVKVDVAMVSGEISADATVTKYVKDAASYKKDTTTDSLNEKAMSFVNETPFAAVTLSASKTVKNGNVADYAGEFTFVASGTKDGSSEVVYSDEQKNDATGKVTFAEIVYGPSDVNNTYIYKVSETKGDNSVIEYDETVYYAVVKVTQSADKSISTEVAYYADETRISEISAMEFVNTKITSGNIVITKSLSENTDRAVAEKFIEFTVKNNATGVEHKYKLTDFDYNETDNKYELKIESVVGEYTVTESVTDVDGYTLKSVSYQVNSGEKVNDRTDAVITVEQDKDTQIDYVDVYEKDLGKLIITKTIKGDIDKDKAVLKIEFIVKNNVTGEEKTYALSDFAWDEESQKYILEIQADAVEYTVTEKTHNISGYELCSVTYAVNGANAVKGKEAIASVEKDGTTTVEFTNEYDEDVQEEPEEPDDVVNTGDDTNLWLWTVMLFISLIVMCSISIPVRREE